MAIATAAAYRRPFFDPEDTLFRRCLAGASIAGVALLAYMLTVPIRHVEITQVAQLPPRFARLIVDPKETGKPATMPVVPHHADPRNANPGGGGGGGAPGALSAPDLPVAAVPGGGARDRAPGPVGPSAGAAGRARAQAEVERVLGGGKGGGAISSALDGLDAAIGGATVDASPASAGSARVRTIRAARSDDAASLAALGGDDAGGSARVGGRGGRGGVGGASADLGHSVVVGSLVAMGGGGGGGGSGVAGGGGGGGGGGTGGGWGGGDGTGIGDGTGPGVGGGSGGGSGGGIGAGVGRGVGAGGRSGVAGPGVYRSNASLLAVIQKYAAGIQYCYGNELKHDPSLRGKLVVAITVAASGEVLQVTIVQNTVGSRALTDGALSQIRAWRFPAIAEGVTAFQAPFVFTPPN